MAKLLWSFAKCNLYNPPLYRALVSELVPLLPLLTPHELTNVLWAVGYHGHSSPELLDAAAALLLSGVPSSLGPWDASVVAWVYGKLQHQHPGLMEALQQHVLSGRKGCREPCLGRLAWACARLDVPLLPPLRARLQEERLRMAAAAAAAEVGGRGAATGSFDGSELMRVRPGNAARMA